MIVLSAPTSFLGAWVVKNCYLWSDGLGSAGVTSPSQLTMSSPRRRSRPFSRNAPDSTSREAARLGHRQKQPTRAGQSADDDRVVTTVVHAVRRAFEPAQRAIDQW